MNETRANIEIVLDSIALDLLQVLLKWQWVYRGVPFFACLFCHMCLLFARCAFYLPPKSRLKIYAFFFATLASVENFFIVSLLEEKNTFVVFFTHFVLTEERQRRHFQERFHESADFLLSKWRVGSFIEFHPFIKLLTAIFVPFLKCLNKEQTFWRK